MYHTDAYVSNRGRWEKKYEGVYWNCLYFLLNFSVYLKLFIKWPSN